MVPDILRDSVPPPSISAEKKGEREGRPESRGNSNRAAAKNRTASPTAKLIGSPTRQGSTLSYDWEDAANSFRKYELLIEL